MHSQSLNVGLAFLSRNYLRKTMNLFSKNILLGKLIIVLLMTAITGCSSPEEKAEKYYQKGMALLESDPDKARLEFSNALQ